MNDTARDAIAGVTLALDASTYAGSVAVLREGVLVAERVVAMRGETEERLMPAVVNALADAGASAGTVARVVCGEGPGSFTSLRIAASIAKGIAFGAGVPLYAVSSLALVVAGPGDFAPGEYVVALDAMRGERFVCRFTHHMNGGLVATSQTVRMSVEALATAVAEMGGTLVGPLESLRAAPHARGVATLLASILARGPVALDAWEPAYGRLPEAQVKWEAAHGRSLAG